MKIYRVEQGSTEWHGLRSGLPTASCFEKIMTPKTKKISTQATKYAYRLLAERITGKPYIDEKETDFMSRGTEMEAEARAWYTTVNGVELDRVGFVTDDAGTMGCSPDSLVGLDGILEVKCLGAPGHIGAILGDAETYELQIQAQMLICERAWCDRLYYHPDMPPVPQRILADADYHAAIREALKAFEELLAGLSAKLIELGCVPKVNK